MINSKSLVFPIFGFLLNILNVQSAYPNIDCHPDSGATQQRCIARGCTWKTQATAGEDTIVQDGNPPSCFFQNTDSKTMAGYDMTFIRNQTTSIQGTLVRRKTPTIFGNDLQKLTFRIEYLTSTLVRVLIQDAANRRFQVPQLHVKRYVDEKRMQMDQLPTADLLYNVDVMKSPFGVAVRRKSTGVILFDTRLIPGFTFADQYLQMSIRLPSSNVYGIGEQSHTQLRHNMTWQQWQMFARDSAPRGSHTNLYGVHPFYMCMENTSDSHGVLLLNSNAMGVMFQPDPIVTFRSIGGILDFFILLGPGPNTVVQQYTELIGRPAMPPYWALGFHLCRYGYSNLTYLEQVFTRNRNASIPQDAQWIDIDYMSDFQDFSYNMTAFTGLSAFVDKLHQTNMKLVLIIDPGIASRPKADYAPLKLGLEMDIFIKDNRTNKPLEGEVWPGATYFPDFTHYNATLYWSQVHQQFQKSIAFDGIWIDMNEPSNFVQGSASGCADNSLNSPPYTPLSYAHITDATLCMDANQYAGKHYDLHNLFGYTEAIATNKALRTIFPGKRPFVLSRSTFVGSGYYTAHWSGDNLSTWPQMAWSVITMLEFNMFGIPFEGSDICGFGGTPTEELCVRWYQVGAYYPFMRSHNDIGTSMEKDPAAWSPKAMHAIRVAILERYVLLPYLYTLMYHAHVFGSSVARPLFFEFPTETDLLGIDDQFFWGSALMIAPILKENATERQVCFPPGRWFELFVSDGAEVSNSSSISCKPYSIPLERTGVFLRGGHIVPWQGAAMTTTVARQNPLGLFIALDNSLSAHGALYWDDGESIDSYESQTYTLLNISLATDQHSATLYFDVVWYGYKVPLSFETIIVMGAVSAPVNVQVNGVTLGIENIWFIKETKTLLLANTALSLAEKFERQVVSWSWQ